MSPFCTFFFFFFFYSDRAIVRKLEWENHTRVVVFILAGLTSDPQMKIFLFIFLLLTYLLSITGNLIIITLTLVDTHLKTSMYFFLWNFSFLEISYTTTCIPKLLVMMATGDKTISYNITQPSWMVKSAGSLSSVVGLLDFLSSFHHSCMA